MFYFGSSGNARVCVFYLQLPSDMKSHNDIPTNHETT